MQFRKAGFVFHRQGVAGEETCNVQERFVTEKNRAQFLSKEQYTSSAIVGDIL